MKFKTGDRVSFLNDTGGGTINRIDPRGTIYVLTNDGFEIPVQEKELVASRAFSYTEKDEDLEKPVVKPAEKPKKNDYPLQQATPDIPANVKEDSNVAFWAGFIPESAGPVFSSKIACYLINDSPYFLYYLAGKKEGGSMIFLSSGYIEPDTKALLASFDQTAISKISHLHIQLLLVSKGRYSRKTPVDRLIDLHPVNFSKESYFRDNEYFEEKAVLFNLADNGSHFKTLDIDIPDDVKETKAMVDKAPPKPKKKEPDQDTLEVDLHFEGESNSKLTPGSILALQMSRFHAAIEEAISKNLRRVVVIHGLGQGTLKMQIRKELQEKYPSFIYQDASFREYGFGATMVHLTIDQK